ncbi:hypothetical protein CIL05_00770 [Virgibacillus profundi]|uniref:DUF4878 domain-containing protein n=1 Tax=Virgibacillus profundi TaxID=2024555 RepID=A0A2A2II60_9BACI|nr:hypothetical protein [Virgibacillus profundi]PAV31222.1 hypothetical protein CIL05_00770 [Virgibacillus profundi]PXY55407.1 hypothetical protein CIT14_00775 [Virgibacillus profundi]
MKKWLLITIMLPIILMGCSNSGGSTKDTSSEGLSENAKAVKEVLEKNLQATQEEEMEAYLNTLVESGRESTKNEIEGFFKDYDIKYELLDFEVLEEEETKMKVESEQRATAEYIAEGLSYHDHIARMEQTFIVEDGDWRISESKIINTDIIN